MPTTLKNIIANADPIVHDNEINETVIKWQNSGFSDLSAHIVAEWCEAKCFDPMAAHQLHEAGLTPSACAKDVYWCDSNNSIAYWVSNCDMDIVTATIFASGDLSSRIEKLLNEAGSHDDDNLVALCEKAIEGDDNAMVECVKALASAAAMLDDEDQ